MTEPLFKKGNNIQMTDFDVFIAIYEAMGREEALFSCYKSQRNW